MPKALILFGSAARGTQTPDSDVDLLAIGSERYASSSKSNGVEIQSYSEEGFFHLAETGDPFGAHIAMEAVAISDPDSLLSAFRESFRLRESYATESGHAFELAKFLLEFGGRFEDQHLVAKRIAWCVRTVLIVRLLESGSFIFSPEGLRKAYPFNWAKELISIRRGTPGTHTRRNLRAFLLHHEIDPACKFDLDEYSDFFEIMGNEVATSTIRKLLRSEDSFDSVPYP